MNYFQNQVFNCIDVSKLISFRDKQKNENENENAKDE